MKEYQALKNIETEVNYIPFYRLLKEEEIKKEYTPYITNGIIRIELTQEIKLKCEEITINKDESQH